MKNIIKILSVALLSALFSFSAVFAQEQDSTATHKHNMNHEHKMDHGKMMKDGKHMMDHDKMMKEGKHMMNHDKMMKDGKHMMDHEKDSATKSLVREGVIDLNSIDKNADGKVFQDMMDFNVISDEPGDCPVCGMHLKEVSIKDAKAKLLEKGFKVK